MNDNLIIVDDLLRDITHEDYEAGRAQFRELSRNCGINDDSVGFFGTVSYPGISDIDGAVIADSDAVKQLQKEFAEARRKSTSFSYLFSHNPVYILEDAWEEAQSLHTLYGLKFLDYSKDHQGVIDARSADGNWLLNIVWFTCLTSFISGLRRRGKASLRMVLLVQKNLEYSLQYFSEACGVGRNSSMASAELRESVFQSPNSDKQWVVNLLFSQFDAVCEAFDKFCEMTAPQVGLNVRYGRWQLANRRTVIKKSSQTSLGSIARFSVLNTNPLAFSLASSFWNPDAAPAIIGDYIQTLYRARDIYRLHGLDNEYLSPFAMSLASQKVPVIQVVNRLARVLT